MTSPDFGGLSDDDLRQLAAELQKNPLSFDPAVIRKGVVTAVDLASSPPVVTVLLSGDTTTPIAGVKVFRAYTPVVGDTTLLLRQGKDLLALGTVAASPYGTTDYVEYGRTTSQSIANNTVVKAAFTTAVETDTGFITVASSTDFTLVKPGRVYVSSTVPWASNTIGSRWAWIGLASDSSTRYAGTIKNPNNGTAVVHNFSITKRFAANTVLSIYTYQDTGSTQTLFPSGVMNLSVHFDYRGR